MFANKVRVFPFKPNMVKAEKINTLAKAAVSQNDTALKIACNAMELNEQQVAAVKEVASRYRHNK